jgi:hypothetical protein
MSELFAHVVACLHWQLSCTLGTVMEILINLLRTKCICVMLGLSPYRAVNALHLGYKNQSVNVV